MEKTFSERVRDWALIIFSFTACGMIVAMFCVMPPLANSGGPFIDVVDKADLVFFQSILPWLRIFTLGFGLLYLGFEYLARVERAQLESKGK